MIWYFTGKPRSGKSYYAVYKLVSVVNSNRYDNVYTNIGGFKFDKFDTVKKLDFEDFFDIYVPALYKEFKKAKKELEDFDQWLIDKIKEDGYFKSAFFVDEVQEYLSNDRVHLRWLFSYQGHLGFDFYLLTQHLGLVHSKYKYTIESVVNSVSSTNKIFSSMLSSPLLDKIFKNSKIFKKLRDSFNYGVYQVYSTTNMARADKMNTFRIHFKKEIFELYKSGDKVTQKSPLLGKLIFIILLLLSVYLYYKYVMGNMKTKAQVPTYKTTVTHAKQTQDSQAVQNNILSFDDSTILLPVHCSFDYCTSNFFNRLPYLILKRYENDIYKVIFIRKLKYSIDIYIETTEHNMRVFSSFSNHQNISKSKSFVGGLME